MAIDAKTISIYMQVTGPYAGQMGRMSAATAGFGNAAHAGFGKANVAMSSWGKTAIKVGKISAIAIAAGLVLSAKAAIDFESSFAGVRKTVETSEAGFRGLALGIRKMATEIPIGVNELNRIAELGGQLGVNAPGLLAFTETIALIGVTTTLSTDEAALGFARLDNIMQLNEKSFDRIGAVIVGLGNNFAATEDEILRFALRVAPIGQTVGLVTAEVLAIATAFTSVGIPAERGGTAVQKTFIKIANAVADGGEKLAIFAETAGLTSDAFAKLFETDPARAFEAFILGLADVEASGRSVFGVLDSVELGNQRVITSLLAMSNAGDTLTDALDSGNELWVDNLALTEEAEKRFKTTASQLTVLKNKLVDVGIAIGTELLPFIGNLASGFAIVLESIAKIPDVAKGAIAAMVGITAAISLANAHPVILAMTAIAGIIALIGHNAKIAEERIRILQDIADDEESREDLRTILTPRFSSEITTVDNLKALGISEKEIRAAITGTTEDVDALRDHANQLGRDLTGEQASGFWLTDLSTTIGAAIGQVRMANKEYNELKENVSADKQSTPSRDLVGELKARELLEGLEQDRELRVGTQAFPIDPEFVDDITDAIGEYSDAITEGFDEVDAAVRSQIDLWFEFDDELEIAWDDIIATLARQITAIGDFNDVLAELDFVPGGEQFIRDSFSTPALKEAFVIFARTGGELFDEWFADLQVEAGRITELVAKTYRDLKPVIDFTDDASFLDSIKSITADVIEKLGGAVNPYSVWLGVLQETITNAEPGMKDRITNLIISALSDDGVLRDSIDLVNSDIDLLLLKLLEFTGTFNAEVIVTTTFTGRPGDADNFDYGSVIPNLIPEREAHGGPVFANKPYIVGELGPELFVPFNSGTIIPNKDMVGTKEVVYNLNVYGSEDTGMDARTVLLTAQTIGSF